MWLKKPRFVGAFCQQTYNITVHYECHRQKYIKQHPDQPQSEAAKDVAMISIDYRIEE